MNCGHLFNGIGGFALAAHWMGWSNIMHCEIDPFCNRVMNHHFPNSHQHEDIRTTDFSIWRGKLDLITGGFPCQPYSNVGERKGKNDERHLWPEMLRAIREIRPAWVVGENVRGLISWNGGMVFDEVQADLETEGYEVLPFLLPAAGVGAPHERYRIWFIAHTNGESRATMGLHKERGKATELESIGSVSWPGRNWQIFPTESPICGANDGLPKRLDDITLSKWKEGALTALGNAVVPQVVYQIFKAIEQYNEI